MGEGCGKEEQLGETDQGFQSLQAGLTHPHRVQASVTKNSNRGRSLFKITTMWVIKASQ